MRYYTPGPDADHYYNQPYDHIAIVIRSKLTVCTNYLLL